MTVDCLTDLHQKALRAFQDALPDLWRQRPGQWVAYRGEQQLGFAEHKHELYQQCFRRGLQRGEFVIFAIAPPETEVFIGPVILD